MEILKKLRKMKNLTQKDMADYLNVTSQAYGKYENGTRTPSYETLKNLANFYNVSVDYLIDRSSPCKNKNSHKIPVYGTIPAGIPTEMIEDAFIEDWEELDPSCFNSNYEYFGLKVKGNSMLPEFRENDTLILRKQSDCISGDYCAVSINHTESTFKKVIKRQDGLTLQPLNAEYEPMFFTNDEVENLPITILGVVVEVRRSYKR